MREESEKSTILFDAPNLMNYTINGAGCTQRTVRVGDSIVIAATDNGTWINTGTNIMTKLPSLERRERPTPIHASRRKDLGYQTVNGLSAQGTRADDYDSRQQNHRQRPQHHGGQRTLVFGCAGHSYQKFERRPSLRQHHLRT